MSAAIDLTAYAPTDMPACLAAAGLLRVLNVHAGISVRLSWADHHARLHLPAGVAPERVAESLTAVAAVRSDSPEWALYDLCDDAAAWESAAKRLLPQARADNRGELDALAACACYIGGAGGRSPLLLTARNVTPGAWARKAAASARETDWARHFERWRDDQGSWQGWRYPEDRALQNSGTGADLAAAWLALEGLTYWPCGPAHNAIEHPNPKRLGDGRSGIGVSGWDNLLREWRYPLPADPVGADAFRSLVSELPRVSHAIFTRGMRQQGGYSLSYFGAGAVSPAK